MVATVAIKRHRTIAGVVIGEEKLLHDFIFSTSALGGCSTGAFLILKEIINHYVVSWLSVFFC